MNIKKGIILSALTLIITQTYAIEDICQKLFLDVKLNNIKYDNNNEKHKYCMLNLENENYSNEDLPLKLKNKELTKISWFKHFSLGMVYYYEYKINDKENTKIKINKENKMQICENRNMKTFFDTKSIIMKKYINEDYGYNYTLMYTKQECE